MILSASKVSNKLTLFLKIDLDRCLQYISLTYFICFVIFINAYY